MRKIKYYWHNFFYKLLCYYRNLELTRYNAIVSKSKILTHKEFERFKFTCNKNNSSIFDANEHESVCNDVIAIVDISHHFYDSIMFITEANIKYESNVLQIIDFYNVALYTTMFNAIIVCDSDDAIKQAKAEIHKLATKQSKSKRKYIAELLYDLLT